MTALIRFALNQRLLMLMLVVLLIIGGYTAFNRLPIDAFPDVSPVQVKIIVKAPGMTPEEIEARITAPLEIELLGIPRQTMLRSIAKYALTDITIDFSEGTDIYWARQQIAERLNAIWEELPDSIQGGIAPMTTPLGEMYMFTIESDQHDLIQRRNLLDWVIRPALRTVPGVADVNALGGLVRSFEVIPDTSRMAARHIAIQQLVAALQNNNRNDGAGRLDIGGEALLVRAQGRIQTLDDVRRIVVDQHQGMPVTVGDIATIQIGALTRYGAVSIDGQGETVEGLVLSLRGANARQTVLDVEEKLKDIEKALPEGVRINTFYNRGELVSRAVSTVAKALVEAIVLVMILLVLFLGNLRAALTVALTLPLAALFTFILMKTADMSANLMSLGGLAIAIGMLVDAAVVVVENVTSQLAQHSKSNHLPRLHLIYRGTKQVAVPVTSGILIIIIVFIPLLTLQGLEGKLFSPVAQTIVFALGGSLLLSLTVIPVLSSYLIREVAHDEPWLPRTLQKLYVPALSWSLAHGRLVVIIAILLLLITIPVYLSIGSIFIPTLDEGDIVLQTEKLPSINLEQSVQLDINIQRTILDQVPEVQSIVTRVGSDEIGLDPMSLNDADNFLVLKPRTEWRMQSKEQLLDAIRQCIQGIPGVSFGFTQPIEMRVSEMLTGVRGDLAVKLFGDEMTVLNRKAGEIKRVLQQIEGASDVFTSENEGMQYLQIHIDHLAAGRFGLSSDRIEQMLRSHIEGLQLGIVQEGKQRTPLILRGSINSADINTLLLALPEGRGNIALSSVARIERVEGLVSIARERAQRFVVVRSNVQGRDLVGFVEEARQTIAQTVKLPPGYLLEFGGQFENQQRAAARLSLVIPLSIGLIFLLLFSTFGSVRQAVMVLSNIPLAMIGGVFALWLSGEYLSVPASVGFIALLGIAVLNGVVMVSYFNQLRATGMPMQHVVIEGSSRRLRPVMMTASIAAIGLIPLLFATGPGSEIQRPLAIVVVGGLITSTLLTLIILPILYQRFAESKETIQEIAS